MAKMDMQMEKTVIRIVKLQGIVPGGIDDFSELMSNCYCLVFSDNNLFMGNRFSFVKSQSIFFRLTHVRRQHQACRALEVAAAYQRQ